MKSLKKSTNLLLLGGFCLMLSTILRTLIIKSIFVPIINGIAFILIIMAISHTRIKNENVEEVITKREQMILILKKAGWYEGRKVDISEFEQQCNEEGIELFYSAKNFLQEFMGIDSMVYFKIASTSGKNGMTNYDYTFDFRTSVYDNSYGHEYRKESFEKIVEVVEEDCFYLGESGYYYPDVVAIGRSGKLYFRQDNNDKVLEFDDLVDSMLCILRGQTIITASLYKEGEEEWLSKDMTYYEKVRAKLSKDMTYYERIKFDLSGEVSSKILELLDRRISLKDFEQWIYNYDQLCDELDCNEYLKLVEFNFHSKDVYYSLDKILYELLDNHVVEQKFNNHQS